MRFSKRQKISITKKPKILIIIVFGIFVILALNFFQKEVRNFFYSISSPLQKKLWVAGDKISDFLSALISANNLVKEKEKLLGYNQALLAELSILRPLRRENKVLKEALGSSFEKEWKTVLSPVAGKDVSEDFILVLSGEKDNMVIGLPVITPTRVLCGTISEVYKNFSKAQLVSHKKSSFDVSIRISLPLPSRPVRSPSPETEISAILKGQGRQRLLVDLIPREASLKQGDMVFSSPLSKVLPPNLLIGEVGKVLRSDIEPFQQAEARPACDIKELEYVFVVTEY